MRLKNGLISIPSFLWNLHGKRTYRSDLILTYLLAITVMLFSILNANELALWEIIVIAGLSLDIGGGVVSNFTQGTINYYRESALSPHLFVWFHALQTLALAIIYDEFYYAVALTMGVSMAGSSIVVTFRRLVSQLTTSVFLFAGVVMLTGFFSELPITLNILMLLMSFKLMVGFSGHYGRKDFHLL